MSADIINLRRARKARTLAGKTAKAASNRAKFGRTKAERTAEAARADLDARRLSDHERAVPKKDGELP